MVKLIKEMARSESYFYFGRFLEDSERNKEIILAGEFLKPLRVGIEHGYIQTVDDFYEELESDQQLVGTEINLAISFAIVAVEMQDALEENQAGQPPLDFWERYHLFSLIGKAIADDERVFLQSNFQPGKEEDEKFIEIVRKVMGKVEAEISQIGD